MIAPTLYRVNSPHVVHQVFEDGEAAIINLKSGAYYSLDPVGAGIWTLIDEGYSQGEIVESIVQRYDGSLVGIINDVNALVAALAAEELIVPVMGSGGGAEDGATPHTARPAAETPALRLPYAAPVLERFNDMQELLLLDPIHEVGEEGWPHARDDQA